jgi:hypothetical protein
MDILWVELAAARMDSALGNTINEEITPGPVHAASSRPPR